MSRGDVYPRAVPAYYGVLLFTHIRSTLRRRVFPSLGTDDHEQTQRLALHTHEAQGAWHQRTCLRLRLRLRSQHTPLAALTLVRDLLCLHVRGERLADTLVRLRRVLAMVAPIFDRCPRSDNSDFLTFSTRRPIF